jgi:hypothetical protein
MNREEHTGLKNFAAVAFFLVLLAGMYFVYRYRKNPTQGDLHSIQDLAALPSSKCTVSSGSFLGASGGNIYIHDGKIRQDVKVINGGEEKMVHGMFSGEDNGTIHIWFDDSPDGIIVTNVYANGGFNVADGTVSCTPWWIVNGNAFILPVDISFKSGQ